MFMMLSRAGSARMTCPSPSAALNNNRAIPIAAPSAQGRPRTKPATEPVALIMTLLGPGVIAPIRANVR